MIYASPTCLLYIRWFQNKEVKQKIEDLPTVFGKTSPYKPITILPAVET